MPENTFIYPFSITEIGGETLCIRIGKSGVWIESK